METVRVRIASVVVSLLCAGLAGCTLGDGDDDGGGTGATPTPTVTVTTTVPVPTRSVSLRLGVHGTEEAVTAYRRIAREYEAAQPGVRISVEERSHSVEDARELLTQAQAGAAPDVFLLDGEQLAPFVEAGVLHPVDQLLIDRGLQFGDDFQRVGLNAFSADFALQCMPAEVSPLVVFYNRRLLRPGRLAPPGEDRPTAATGWDWEQFLRGAQRIARQGVTATYLPPTVEAMLPFIRSAGGDLVDDEVQPTSLTLSSTEATEALTQLGTLARNPRLSATPIEIADEDEVARFEDGRLGMILGHRDLVPRLREATDLRFDVFPLPSLGRAHSLSEVDGYCIPTGTQDVEAAADFIAWAVGPEGAAIAARSGAVVPSNLEALFSEDFIQPGSFPRSPQVFADAVRRSEPEPYAVGWPEVEQRVDRILARVLYAPAFAAPERVTALLERVDERSSTWLAPTPPPTPTEPTTETPAAGASATP